MAYMQAYQPYMVALKNKNRKSSEKQINYKAPTTDNAEQASRGSGINEAAIKAKQGPSPVIVIPCKQMKTCV